MKTSTAIIVAVIVILILALAWWAMKKHDASDSAAAAAAAASSGTVKQPASKESFGGPEPPGHVNPYALLNNNLDAIRGLRNDGYDQPPIYAYPGGLERYIRSGATVTPDQLATAEQMSWFEAKDRDGSGPYNTELAYDSHSDVMQYHDASPSLDYNAHITDLVTDPRVVANHNNWVEEMKPWSGAVKKVDDLNEAMEASLDFQGLRRPQAIVQYNPTQLTEIGPDILAPNKKFNFMS